MRGIFKQLVNMGLLNKPSAETLTTWANGLSDLSEAKIRMGVANAKDFTEYFNLPAFRELCRVTPANLGMPEARTAYIEACQKPTPWDRQQWSHPVVLSAAMETGQFELHNKTEKECFPLFSLNYGKMVERAINGEDLNLPVMKALPEQIPQYLSKDENKSRLEKLKAML